MKAVVGAVRMPGLLLLAFAVLAMAGAAHAQDSAGVQARSCAGNKLGLASLSSPRTYDDVVEETAGPDICFSNVVTNDNESIFVGIHMHNRSGFRVDDTYSAYLDTDQTETTGSNGAEYVVTISGGHATLARFNGATFEPTTARVEFTWVAGYGPLLMLSRSELPTDVFDFYLEAKNTVGVDRAPDIGVWAYALRPLRLAARSLSLSRAKLGKTFTARLQVIRSDWNIELEEGQISCSAKLGRTRLRGRSAFKGGRAVCSWRLPRRAAGRLLTGRLGVSFQGVEARRSFAVRVRR